MRLMRKQFLTLLAGLLVSLAVAQPALAAGILYMPGVTAQMSDYAYWAQRQPGAQQVILTQAEIQAFNADTAKQDGTMVIDLKAADATFDGLARKEAVRASATADAEYYFGWTLDSAGRKLEWADFQAMIDNCADPKAAANMPVRYGVAVNRTVLRVFPSDEPLLDDVNDQDFDYQSLSAVCVNDPLLIYLTSADGKYYMARSRDCSGWLPVEDVALCADKAEWLSAWDLPQQQLLVVYGNKVYTDASNSAPETARRMLTQGTALELVNDLPVDHLVNNRSAYHNYVVYLPVREADGSYAKQMALLPETAQVSVGYLPLTYENIAKVSLCALGDAYGWGGMLDVEDCSGMVRTVYSCFGLHIGRNGNWQWEMNMAKIVMTNMSAEEKCYVLDNLPLGAALCFPGHEMIYLGKVDGDYYVVSTVGSIMSPNTGKLLRTRDVMINRLDVKRASGMTWLGALDKAFMPCYAQLPGKTYNFPALKWYHDGVAWCLAENILPALDIDGTFGVGQPATRGDLVQALWAMAGKPATGILYTYEDIPENDALRQAVTWAAEARVMQGLSDRAFAPEQELTLKDVVLALYRVTQNQAVANGAAPAVWRDDNEETVSAFRWAVTGPFLANGGDSRETITRERLAAFLWRYNDLYAPAPAEPAA